MRVVQWLLALGVAAAPVAAAAKDAVRELLRGRGRDAVFPTEVEIVNGADVANGFAACSHENRVGDGRSADQFHAGQERAVGDARGAKNGAVAGNDFLGVENTEQIRDRKITAGEFGFFRGVVLEPHAELDIASQRAEGVRCENAFRSSPDADIEINAGVG